MNSDYDWLESIRPNWIHGDATAEEREKRMRGLSELAKENFPTGEIVLTHLIETDDAVVLIRQGSLRGKPVRWPAVLTRHSGRWRVGGDDLPKLHPTRNYLLMHFDFPGPEKVIPARPGLDEEKTWEPISRHYVFKSETTK